MGNPSRIVCNIPSVDSISQAQEAAHGSSCAAVQTSLDSLLELRVTGAARQWVGEVEGMADTSDKFASSQDHLLRGVASTLDQYVSEELKRDVPTGMGAPPPDIKNYVSVSPRYDSTAPGLQVPLPPDQDQGTQ